MDSNPLRDPRNRAFYLPRLPREHYQGDAVVFWTLMLFDRAKGWLTPDFHHEFRELMFHTAAREGLVCPVYCLMPNHIHLVWMGLRLDTDQINGMAFFRTYLEPALKPAKFQPQPQDEVLRDDRRKKGAFAKFCFYTMANPVRAELVTKPEEWPFTNCMVPGYPKIECVRRRLLVEVLENLRQTTPTGRGKYQTAANLINEPKCKRWRLVTSSPTALPW